MSDFIIFSLLFVHLHTL